MRSQRLRFQSPLRTILLAVCAALLFAGIAAAQTELTLVVHWANTAPQTQLLEEYLAEYEEENPDVRINLLATGTDFDEMLEQVVVMMAGGVPPAAVHFQGGDFLAQIAWPLPASTVHAIEQAYLPQVLTASHYRGRPLGFRTEYQVPGMAYNKTMFDEAGIALNPDEPFSWDEIFSLSELLTRRMGDEIIQKGINIPPGQIYNALARLVLADGGALFDDDGTPRLDRSDVISAAERLARVFIDGNGEFGWYGHFADLNSAMAFAFPYVKFPIVAAHPEEYEAGVFQTGPIPYGSLGRPVDLVGVSGAGEGWTWSVINGTGVEEEAVRLLEWLNLHEMSDGTTRMGNVLMELGSLPVTYSDIYNQDAIRHPFIGGFVRAMETYDTVALPDIPGVAQWEGHVQQAMVSMINEQVSAVQAFGRAQQEYEADLARAKEDAMRREAAGE